MADPGTIDVHASAHRADDHVEVTLELDIPEGTHIEAHEPPDPLLIPTVVEFDDLDVTRVRYPEPSQKDLGFPGQPPLLVYEGRVAITAAGRLDENVDVVHGTIRCQPCVGGACLPPRDQRWQAPIRHLANRV